MLRRRWVYTYMCLVEGKFVDPEIVAEPRVQEHTLQLMAESCVDFVMETLADAKRLAEKDGVCRVMEKHLETVSQMFNTRNKHWARQTVDLKEMAFWV